MGIPHLITFLRPYSESSSLNGKRVVIDGPGFAYHIYFVALARRCTARNPFEGAPSYAELGRIAIEWLDELQKSHVIIERIFFDGFLPPEKLSVRVERLIASTKLCLEYHQAYPGPVAYRRVSASLGNAATSPFAGAPPQGSSKLPALPFLVPAIIEALLDSERYKNATVVVPGEADVYCAKYINLQGGIVFTGDSDLLAHDLGPDGAVSFFRDIEILIDGSSTNLRGRIYHIPSIVKRLELPPAHGIKSLAFEILMDPYKKFRKLLLQASSLAAVTTYRDEYAKFALQYETMKDYEQTKYLAYDGQWPLLQRLDPRTSEYILQFEALREIVGGLTGVEQDSKDENHIFLPVLLDCPTRTNSWEMSITIRLLAYALVNLIIPEGQRKLTITEHVKQLNQNGGREWQLPTMDEIPDALTALVKLLRDFQARMPGLSGFDYWKAISVCQDVEWSTSNDKVPLSNILKDSHGSVRPNPSSKLAYSWDIVHSYAQFQGSYYSFRILKQITLLLMSQKVQHPLPDAVIQLSQILDTLPPLRDLPDFGDFIFIKGKLERAETLKIVYDILGIPIETPSVEQSDPSARRTKKKRKRKRNKQGDAGDSTETRGTQNPFELLQLG